VDLQVTTHQKAVSGKEVPPDIRQGLSLVRHRQSQRAAIIAGLVLGPPKTLERER
jgi:hypothetical protein